MNLTVNANGAAIPAIGFGTWQLTGRETRDAVRAALEVGYRHIDTAAIYDNEREVGQAIQESDVPRADVFVTTKVWRDDLAAGTLQRSAEDSLKRLGLDYVDLFLIHWPNQAIALSESIPALCEVSARGLARHIGVSNFTAAMLDEAVALADRPLATNQVEYHPFLDQSKVLAACRKHGLSLTAYCPLARGRVFSSPALKEIARAKGRTVSQVASRWLIQQPGVISIPRTSKPERVRENFQVFDFELTDEEMRSISALAAQNDRVVNLAWAPAWD